MNLFSQILPITVSDIIALIGLTLTIISVVLIWRKKLLKIGFDQFKSDYDILQRAIRIEIDDFKTDVRGYIRDNQERHMKTLDRVVELYENIHKEIQQQNRVCDLVQATKPHIQKQENQWKASIKSELDEALKKINMLSKKISHIEDCVNNKKKS